MKKTTSLITNAILGSVLVAIVGCSSTAKKPQNQLIMTQFVESKSSKNNALTGEIGAFGTGSFISGSGSTSCCGAYTGLAYITNSATGTYWFTPPSGTTNGIATDASGLASPYESVVKVIRNDSMSWCGTNSVSFPASSNKQYKFMIYVKNTPPPPSAGDTLTVSVQWQP